ncbi:MAG: RNA-binding protein [Kiritimatiellia bacterium]
MPASGTGPFTNPMRETGCSADLQQFRVITKKEEKEVLLSQCTISNPTLLAVVCGAAGFISGFIVAKFAKGGAVGKNGECVEIYVGNLSYDMTESQMRKEFEKYGTVKSARIITHRFNQRSKGFGFVEMPNRNEAEAAIKATNGKEVMGRKLRTNEAKNKSRD